LTFGAAKVSAELHHKENKDRWVGAALAMGYDDWRYGWRFVFSLFPTIVVGWIIAEVLHNRSLALSVFACLASLPAMGFYQMLVSAVMMCTIYEPLSSGPFKKHIWNILIWSIHYGMWPTRALIAYLTLQEVSTW
jgi:hypothetical protein